MEGQRRAAATLTSSQPSPFDVRLGQSFTIIAAIVIIVIVVVRVIVVLVIVASQCLTSFHCEFAVTLRATLVPVPRCANQELPSTASTLTNALTNVRSHSLTNMVTILIFFQIKCVHLPSFVSPNPAPPLLPVVESQVPDLKHLHWLLSFHSE